MRRLTREQKRKKETLLVFVLFILCQNMGTALCDSGSDTTRRVFEVPFIQGRISVNGILDEWSNYPRIGFSQKKSNPPSEWGALVKATWDEEKLYLAFRIKDQDLIATETRDGGMPWRDDAVEVYLSVKPDQVQENKMSANEYQFIVNLNGAVGSCRGTTRGARDHSWDADILSGVRWKGSLNDSSGPADKGYTVEMAIPWASINFKPQADAELLVNFGVSDRKEKSGYHAYDWSGLVEFGDPMKWNSFVLLRAPTTQGDIVIGEKADGQRVIEKPYRWSRLLKWLIAVSVSTSICVGWWLLYAKKRHGESEEIPEATGKDEQGSNAIVNNEVCESLQVLATRVKQLVLSEYSEDITANAISRKLRVSERHMRRALKDVEGKTFGQILQDIRLGKSCKLLATSQLSISEISQKVGFSEQAYFSRLFKGRYSVTPSEYRSRSLKN